MINMDSILKTQRSRKIAYCVIITILFSLIGHMYFFTSNAFTHDSLIFYSKDANWQISLGRFGNPVFLLFRGNTNVPWIIGVSFILFSCFSVYTLCQLFTIESPLQIASIAAVIILNPFVVIQIATYSPWADIYACAQFLIILSIYLMYKKKYGFLAGTGLIAFSLSLYASYFALACMLSIICLWCVLLNEKKQFKNVIAYICKAIFMLAGSILVYSVTNKLVLHFMGITSAESYNSISNAYNFNMDLFKLFKDTYGFFATITMHPVGIYPLVALVLNIILLCILVAEFFLMLRDMLLAKNAWVNSLIFVLSVLLLPFASSIIYFINKRNMHGLMMTQFYYFFLIPIFIHCANKNTDNRRALRSTKVLACVSIVVILVLSWDSILYSNSIYLNKRLAWERTESIATRVVDRIENEELYQAGITKVYISGTPDQNPNYQQNSDADYLFTPMSENQNVGLSWKYAVSYPAYWSTYIHDILSINMKIISPYEDHVELDPIIEQMPIFPAKDSVQWIGDVLVVKMS